MITRLRTRDNTDLVILGIGLVAMLSVLAIFAFVPGASNALVQASYDRAVERREARIADARADLWNAENCPSIAAWSCWERNPYR